MDRYSRIIALLKVVLPLAALVLLSTLFLISRGAEQDTVIPFAQKEIEERMRGQQITAPFFAGSTANGDDILVSANNVRSNDGGNPATAVGLFATLRFAKGGHVRLTSDQGNLQPDKETAQFLGAVTIVTEDGMRVETERLDTHLNEIFAQSPGTVHATSTLGSLTAGSLRIHTKSQGDAVHILFNNGVKLVYEPQQSER